LARCAVSGQTTSITISVGEGAPLLTISRQFSARVQIEISDLGSADSPFRLSFAQDVELYSLTSDVDISPTGSAPWKIRQLTLTSSAILVPSSTHPSLLTIEQYSPANANAPNLHAFQAVKYDPNAGITPYTVAGGIKWIRLPRSYWDPRPGTSVSATRLSFAVSGGSIIELDLTDGDLTITTRTSSSDSGLSATISDVLGVGYQVSGFETHEQTVTVTGNSLPEVRLTTPYLLVPITQTTGWTSSTAVSTFTVGGSGWRGDGNVRLQFPSIAASYVGKVVLNDARVGLDISVTEVELTAVDGARMGTAAVTNALRLAGSGSKTIYIDHLNAKAVVSSNGDMAVIAGDVDNIRFWNVSLTVRVSFDPAWPATSSAVPYDYRYFTGPLTLSRSATVTSATNPSFWNRTSFANPPYYISIPSIPSLSPLGVFGPGRYRQPDRDVTALVCGVDCNAFEVLLKDGEWYTEPSPENALTARQTCVKYSDYSETTVSSGDSEVNCVALKANYAAPTSVTISYPSASAMSQSRYEVTPNYISEATKLLTINGQSSTTETYFNTGPVTIDLDVTRVQDCEVTFGSSLPLQRTIGLRASRGRINQLVLSTLTSAANLSVSDASRPLSVKSLDIRRYWSVNLADLDWNSLQEIQLPHALYVTDPTHVSQIRRQVVIDVNPFPGPGGRTVLVDGRQISIGSSTFSAPNGDGPFVIELRIGLPGTSSLEVGPLTFSGSGPAPGGQYILDFLNSYLTGQLRLGSQSPSWTAPANLTIQAPTVYFDVTGEAERAYNYTLEWISSIGFYSSSSPVSRKVRFTGSVTTTTSFTFPNKIDTTAIELRELHLGTASLTSYCTASTLDKTCFGVQVARAFIPSGVTIPFGWTLSEYVSVSGSVTIASNSSFQASSLVLDETSLLLFSESAPAQPPTSTILTFNVTNFHGGPLTATEIVRLNNNGSIFHEFNRSVGGNSRRVVCAVDFSGCANWQKKIEDNAEITGRDLGSGAEATVSFECGPDTSGYVLAYSMSGDVSSVPRRQCLYAKVDFRGGDPKTAHYSAPAAEKKGLSAGDIAAIVLGVILALGIGTVIVLVVLGKLKWAGGSATVANTAETPETP
jgi:hypothetical protein